VVHVSGESFAAKGSDVIETGHLATSLVPGPVAYKAIVPDGTAGQALPLFLCLHGGVGGHDLIDQMGPVVRELWAAAALPDMAVAAPETGASFYLDYRDGSQRWETFVMKELLPHLRARYAPATRPQQTLVGGISMGGMGALRLGLKYPDAFGAIIAWEPSIEPAYEWRDVKLEDRFYRSDETMEARFGRPFDEAYWALNNPATIVKMNARAIRAAGIRIYLEAGTDDAYGLCRGAEFLHRTLYDHDVRHEYRQVFGADHIGPTILPRLRDGLAFAARILRPPPPDERVSRLRELVATQKRRAGLQA
jgi:S-formylglutathione hydrolase